MGQRWLRGCMAMAVLALAAVAQAQDVTLSSRDGTLVLSGTLQGFDGAYYRIESEFGALTVDAAGVTCEGPGCPDLTARVDDILVVGEADAARGLVPALFGAFAAARGHRMVRHVEAGAAVLTLVDASGAPAARIRFAAMAPAAAAEALRSGAADLAVTEVAVPGLNAHVLGQQALVAVVAPDNPLASLGTADLARALAGGVADWADLGGPSMPLVVHGPAAGSGLRRAIEARLGQPVAVQVGHASTAALAAAVTRDPYAIAVMPAAAAGAARVLALTDSCGQALVANAAAVRAGDYPLVLPLHVLTPRRRLPLILRDFLDFLGSPAAAAAVAAEGLVDRTPQRVPLLADGQRLAAAIRAAGADVPLAELQRLAAAMAGADRLSATFRFEGATQTLDAESRASLDDLVRRIDAGLFAGHEIVFTGFSDGSGTGTANLALSRDRADLVREAVAGALTDRDSRRTALAVEAFGEALPLACDESPVGRRINRRVEVWLRPLGPESGPGSGP